jgi:hypothetical protein
MSISSTELFHYYNGNDWRLFDPNNFNTVTLIESKVNDHEDYNEYHVNQLNHYGHIHADKLSK